MRIEIDIPDWADERHIRILAGRELAAAKLAHEDFWRVKDVRCNHCGKCCPEDCKHLVNNECINRRICYDDPWNMIKKGECIITHKII